MDISYSYTDTDPLELEVFSSTEDIETSYVQTKTTDNSSNSSIKWTDGQTSLLLWLYKSNCNNIGPSKPFRSKLKMWKYLSNQLNKTFNILTTPRQVETRYRCVMKRRKKTIDIDNIELDEIEFDEVIENNVEIDDSHIPDCLVTPGSIKKLGLETITSISRPHSTYSAKIGTKPHDGRVTRESPVKKLGLETITAKSRPHTSYSAKIGMKPEDSKMDVSYSYTVIDPVELESSTEDINNSQNAIKWSDAQTRFLLWLYKSNYNNIGPVKQFRSKLKMWEYLSDELNKTFNILSTPRQVETRYRCVMKRRKKKIDINNIMLDQIEFDEVIENNGSIDDSNDNVVTKDLPTRKLKSETIKSISQPSRTYSPKIHPPSTKQTTESILHSDYSSQSPPAQINFLEVDSEARDTDNFIDENCEVTSVSRRKRIRKSVQEQFCEKLLEIKKEKIRIMEEYFERSEAKKDRRHREKEEMKERRHQEKLSKLDKIIKNQRHY